MNWWRCMRNWACSAALGGAADDARAGGGARRAAAAHAGHATLRGGGVAQRGDGDPLQGTGDLAAAGVGGGASAGGDAMGGIGIRRDGRPSRCPAIPTRCATRCGGWPRSLGAGAASGRGRALCAPAGGGPGLCHRRQRARAGLAAGGAWSVSRPSAPVIVAWRLLGGQRLGERPRGGRDPRAGRAGAGTGRARAVSACCWPMRSTPMGRCWPGSSTTTGSTRWCRLPGGPPPLCRPQRAWPQRGLIDWTTHRYVRTDPGPQAAAHGGGRAAGDLTSWDGFVEAAAGYGAPDRRAVGAV